MTGADRFNRALLPRWQQGASTLFVSDHAANSLFAAVVHLVGPGHGRDVI